MIIFKLNNYSVMIWRKLSLKQQFNVWYYMPHPLFNTKPIKVSIDYPHLLSGRQWSTQCFKGKQSLPVFDCYEWPCQPFISCMWSYLSRVFATLGDDINCCWSHLASGHFTGYILHWKMHGRNWSGCIKWVVAE